MVCTLVFSFFAQIPSDGIPYPLFSYCALLPWVFFASAINRATHSLVNNRNLITKIYFPREIFPLSTVIASSLDFLIASTIFLGMLIFYNVALTLYVIFIIPVLMVQLVLMIGIVFAVSALNVFFRDVGQAVPLIIQLWMYATPVIYPISLVPEKLRPLYMLNPMASIIDSYRKTLLSGESPDLYYLVLAMAVTLIFFFLAYKFFKSVEMKFADII